MKQPGVLGTAVGFNSAGAPALIIYVDRAATSAGDIVRSLPATVRGIGTRVELTDKFRAMQLGGLPGLGSSHTAKQTPPIKLGVSGGWSKDLANGYCCGRTLGSLVSIGADGSILEIGPLSSQTVGAALNQKVKKSGRTTGLTRSSISGLNTTISVEYDNECAGGVAFTKTFTGQIVISNLGRRFLDSGDSGSLMVEDAATRPRAIGLLFAGSVTQAIANPIDQVLSFLGATMVGN